MKWLKNEGTGERGQDFFFNKVGEIIASLCVYGADL